jgi:phasin
MTTDTNSVLNTVKEAFAPVTEAFTKLQNLEVPEAAREFVKKQAETAKVRAADMHAGSEKVTAAIETAVAGSVSEAAKISRNIQQAFYQDAEAFFAGIDKLASAKSLSEAAQIQSDLVRARGEVLVSRAKATEYPASSSPTVPRPRRTISPRSTPRPPDRDPPDNCISKRRSGGPSFPVV